MTILNLPGRVLLMVDDPDSMRSQLAGEDLPLTMLGALRHDISTDEITTVLACSYYDERLGDHVYSGVTTKGLRPIEQGGVKAGGFSVTVAGRRYGKGSSREHSPAAELHAGIRLVIAESFERIYRQNADNVGLFTSTDFSLVERIRRGEPIQLDELVASRDSLAAEILRAGGLIQYGLKHIATADAQGTTPQVEADSSSTPRTLAHKILARNVVATKGTTGRLVPGEGAFVKTDWRFIIESYTGMAAHRMHAAFGRPLKLAQPQTILGFAEHFPYIAQSAAHIKGNLVQAMRQLYSSHQEFVTDYGIRNHGYLEGGEGSEGICHPMMAERYALPGQLIVGTDSHTPHSGAIGCLAFGVGTTDMANAMLTGVSRLTVPETLRVNFDGTLPAGISGKDLALMLLSQPEIKSGAGVGMVFEFGGACVRRLSIDERTTLTNMAAELGGFTGIVEPDDETVKFLKERRGIDFELEPWMRSDEGAFYARVITLDCSDMSPMVAAPGDPGNSVPLKSIDLRPKIDIAFAGTCTGGKRGDFDTYFSVLSWAAQRGLRVAPNVKFYLQYGTGAVREYCEERGYLSVFEKVGAIVLQPACGACAALGPGQSTSAEQVTVSAQNRNWPGRSGPGSIWLAGPATVAASAIAGELASFEELQGSVDALPAESP